MILMWTFFYFLLFKGPSSLFIISLTASSRGRPFYIEEKLSSPCRHDRK